MAIKRSGPVSSTDESRGKHIKSSPGKGSATTIRDKWTEKEIKLVIELKAQGLSEIAKFLSGRSVDAVRFCYKKHIQEHTEVFTPEKLDELKEEILGYHKNMWSNIGNKIGMSANGCKKAAKQMGLEIAR